MTFMGPLYSKKSPTNGPTGFRTPKKPEYLIARSQLTKVRSVGKVPFNFSLIYHTIPMYLGILDWNMGIVWETYHKGVPMSLGVPENLTEIMLG